ncbi:K(+)-transporting ATPase subunit F [Ralstonia solanacearum]|nr:K(+)-transporting ATPase subunit F [Ralstonia solanacearum]AXW13664.1 K(+)-transporting ATPase subunit F [Ralstonia solanacearum]
MPWRPSNDLALCRLGAITVALLIYLFAALLWPERF